MEKKKIPLTKEEKNIHLKQRFYYICKKGFSSDDDDNKKCFKVTRPLSLYWKI